MAIDGKKLLLIGDAAKKIDVPFRRRQLFISWLVAESRL
jgi:hypothetical protein